MDKSKSQPRNTRRSTKTLMTSTSAAPVVSKVPTSKADSGSGRASSASDSVILDSSPSRSSSPDAIGALSSSAAIPKYRYSREELLNLMNSPLSKIKPEICSSLHKLFDGNSHEADSSAFDEQAASMRQALAIRKHLNLGGEPQSFANQLGVGHDDGPVLVPQRLNFSAGCHVASTGSVSSPDLKRERNRRDGHRIGSGRIQISEKLLDRELRDHRSLCNRDQDQDDRWLDQSGGGSSGFKVLKRDYERRRQEVGRGGRYGRGSRGAVEDPEWFTDGPLSQSDTIELWGFDQGHGSKSCLKDASSSANGDNVSKLKSATKHKPEVGISESVAKEPSRNEVMHICSGEDGNEEKVGHAPSEKNSPLKPASNRPTCESENDPTSGAHQPEASPSPVATNILQNADAELDFNAIFSIDSMPGISEMFGLDPEQARSGGSRFKQWFHFGSHGNSRCGDSRRSSLTDEFGYIDGIICGRGSPVAASSPPMPQPVYGSAAYSAEECSGETQNLLELLQKAHGNAIGSDLGSSTARNGGAVRGLSGQNPPDSANAGTSFTHSAQNSVDTEVDAKAVEEGLKAILSGSVLSSSLLSALPSMAHLSPLTAIPPPSGAKVLLAEELEAQLVTASSDRSESSCAATASSLSQPSNFKTSADSSRTLPHLTSSCSGNNSGNLSFSLPVLPIGTKVTLLSELEACVKGLDVAGRAAASCQPPDGSTDGSLSSAVGWPVSSHSPNVGPGMLSVNAFTNRLADLAAYKKLLGLVVDPYNGQTALDATLPIVTSPTSVSMSSLEANQPNNSLANNQRDFIQRYLLQQQQLKMLNRPQPLHSDGTVHAPSGIPPHILPPDVPHPLYMTSGAFVDRVPSGQAIGSLEPSMYGRPSAGPSLKLRTEDDLALLSSGLSPEFCGGRFPIGSYPLANGNGQVYHSPARGADGPSADSHSLLLETMGGKQPPSQARHSLHHPPVNHAVPAASLHGQQQQAAKMMHLTVQERFSNSAKAGLSGPSTQSPIPPPLLALQPPVLHPPATVAALPSPGFPILAPQTMLQQPPQSPRRAPSPLMFGSQPPMNLTAPLPVHLGSMPPILSPVLSPNTLQVAQPGSNLSSPVMRVPSPQELSGLAQSILQNALIKKQLEEQKERFVKRQQERNKSPKAHASLPIAMLTSSNNKSSPVTSASATVMNHNALEAGKTLPSSFLPTSVLRKMVNTKVEEKMAGRFAEVEKNVPLLKVVKPDEEDGSEVDNRKDSKENQTVTAKAEGQNGATKLITDDQSSEASVKCGFAVDNSNPEKKPDVTSSNDSGQHSSLTSTSAGCLPDDAGFRPSAARRLVGQGLMNLNSSSSFSDVPSHQMSVEPTAALTPFPTVVGVVPSGRQIKGKKLSEQLPLSMAVTSGGVKTKAELHLAALRQQQQQLHQMQLLIAGGNNSRGGIGAPGNALHALEMAKILEQQGLVSPVPILPPPAPPLPPGAAHFVQSVPGENGAFGVKQLPRMILHPPFGMNSSAANALLLQSLGRSNLQRAALPSVNQMNQLALMQAMQLQAQQQQQQQQQHMWNQGPICPPASSRPACPGFLLPNQSSTNSSAYPSASNVANGNGIGTQNGSVSIKAPFDGTGSGQSVLVAKSENDNAGHRQTAESTPSVPVVSGAGYDVLNDGSQPTVTGVGNGSHRLDHHRLSTVKNDCVMDGNLSRWFGSDVFHQDLPRLLATAGQRVLTVDEIECWQHMVLIGLLLLYYLLGTSALLSGFLILMMVFLQYFIADKLGLTQEKIMEQTDERLKKSNEALQNIKLLKLYAWEKIFYQSIIATRTRELRLMLTASILRVVSISVTDGIPYLACLLTFTLYHYMESEPLHSGKVFSGLALFSIFNGQLFVIAIMINVTYQAKTSIARLRDFLLLPEIPSPQSSPHQVRGSTASDEPDSEVPLGVSRSSLAVDGSALPPSSNSDLSSSEFAIEVMDGNFGLSGIQLLHDINIKIPTGKLTMVIGPVGSGKSSILWALLGEMNKFSGEIIIRGRSIAFVAQKSWIINSTVAGNITFGLPFDPVRYNDVIKVSGLQRDLESFPAGDQTEIGEKGANLSGGQRQRVSIARALYCDSDIYFMDDPLSALDAQVGSHIFEEAIIKSLIGRGKTVLLVTHHVQYLPRADHLIQMQNGRVIFEGFADSLSAKSLIFSSSSEDNSNSHLNMGLDQNDRRPSFLRRSSVVSGAKTSVNFGTLSIINDENLKRMSIHVKDFVPETVIRRLIEEEEVSTGAISYRYFVAYFQAGTWLLTVSAVFLYSIRLAFRMYGDYWLTDMVDASALSKSAKINAARNESVVRSNDKHPKHEPEYYLVVYSCLSVIAILLVPVGILCLELMALTASRTLHQRMLQRVICAPLRFFDTNPIGRIVNRLSADMNVIDEKMVVIFDSFLFCVLAVIGGIVINCVFVPYFLLPVAPIVILFIIVQRFCMTSCRELQRIDCSSKSPILAHFSQVLAGISTIRAYKCERRFQLENFEKIDANNVAFLFFHTSHLWLGLRLDYLGSVLVLAACLSGVTACLLGAAKSSTVGFVISYAIMTSSLISWTMRYFSEMEVYFGSVERIIQYSAIDSEPYETSQGELPPKEWPSAGEIIFESVSLKYSPELDSVVRDFSLHIKPGSKLGICGRTGSGKSSMTLSMFRMVYISKGRILLDGYNISDVPLELLRSKISIIPQEPVLFSGTVRFNLDPLVTKTDDELWKALEIAQLSDLVLQLPHQLDMQVTEGGDNFSIGQKQMFCLARALLRDSKLLIMDEATASIDSKTDFLIQQIVKKAFSQCTVITIAHRLSTILSYDQIIVLRDGRMIEEGKPSDLIKANGVFARMLAENKM